MNVEDVPAELIPFATDFHFQIGTEAYVISRTARTSLGAGSTPVADGKWCVQRANYPDICLYADGSWRYKSYAGFDNPGQALRYVKAYPYAGEVTPGNAPMITGRKR